MKVTLANCRIFDLLALVYFEKVGISKNNTIFGIFIINTYSEEKEAHLTIE